MTSVGPAAGETARLAHLDGWRGLAILLVLAGHFTPLGWIGPLGVELFFALSGRLMAELLIVRQQALRQFLLRRASRVLPALFVYVALMSLVLTVSATLGGRTDWHASALAMLGFVHNYLPTDQAVILFDHGWTLAVEEHAYLLLALIALVCARRRGAAILVAFTVASLAIWNGVRLAAVPVEGAQPFVWRTDVRVASMLLPFGLYLLLEQGRAPGRLWRWVSPSCLAAGLCVLGQSGLSASVQFSVGSGFLAFATATLDRSHPAFRRLLASPILVWPGLMSFSLYLWNQPFFAATLAGAPVAVCLLLAVGAATWSYHRIEKPARAALNARWTRPSGGAAPALA